MSLAREGREMGELMLIWGDEQIQIYPFKAAFRFPLDSTL